MEVACLHEVAGCPGCDAESRGNHRDLNYGKAVKAVSEVDRVRGADDHAVDERDEEHAEPRHDVLEEGDDELGLLLGVGREVEPEGNDQGGCRLPEELPARLEPARVMARDLEVVVREADCSEGDDGEEHDPYVVVLEIAPEQDGEKDAREDHHAAHRRGAVLLEVGLRPAVADDLPEMELPELSYGLRADEEREDERREERHDRAEGLVGNDVEHREMRRQQLCKVVKHLKVLKLVPDEVKHLVHLHAVGSLDEDYG